MKYRLEFVVFICGAVVMMLELVGSRILAPYIGTSMYVWTSLIGVVLGSLSIGYYLGGKRSDRNPSHAVLSRIIFASAVCVLLISFLNTSIPLVLARYTTDLRIQSFLMAIVLFAPASVLLGMVSPYSVKLSMKALAYSGSTVGTLYAISTIGSIVGTFITGYFLFALVGSVRMLFILSSLLLIASFVTEFRKDFILRIIFVFVLIIVFSAEGRVSDTHTLNIRDYDSSYNRIWIYDTREKAIGKTVRMLRTNGEYSSAMYAMGDELVFPYTRYYRLAKHFRQDIKNALMIGGGAYSYPKDYLKRFPDAKMDVVELDPMVTLLAKTHFGLENNSRLTIYHEDARTFLNREPYRYDVIFADAFTSYVTPFQLTSREAIKHMYEVLDEEGIVIMNLISPLQGEGAKFFLAQYKTYKNVFPRVYAFAVHDTGDKRNKQNIILIASKSDKDILWESTDQELNEYLKHRIEVSSSELDRSIVLTDDYAPVEYYTLRLFLE